MRKVLQLAGRIEGLKRLKKPLQAGEPIPRVLLLLLGQYGAAPEDQLWDSRLGGDNLAKQLGGSLLNLGHSVVAVRGVNDKPLGHVQQIAQILERTEG